jgi:hypothetical protein
MDTFKKKLKEAIRNHYQKVQELFDDLYGYTLYTDDSLCSIGPVYNRESDISVQETDEMYPYYKYLAVEWAHFEDYDMFSKVNSLLQEIMDCDHPEWQEKREEILEVCLSVLGELDEAGLFGAKESGRFIAICIADSDDSIMERSVKELNNSGIVNAYIEKCI